MTKFKGWNNRETYSANACINTGDQDRGYWTYVSERCTRNDLIDKLKHSYRYYVGIGLFDVSPKDADKVDWEQIADGILPETS